MINCIAKEAEMQKYYLGGDRIKSIYFGGGTPSMLKTNEAEKILNSIYKNFDVDNNSEITFEANPDDITLKYIEDLKNIGINRLSIGIQSFFDDDLHWMNRRHTAQQSFDSVIMSNEGGIDNINIDLIYGIPGMSNDKWKSNVENAFSLKIKHLSAYLLTIEPKTVFGHYLKKGIMEDVSEDTAIDHYILLKKLASEKGFIQYEISNFALPGFFSLHNQGYWKSKKYLGIGPSANSFDGISRQWNIKNNSEYISSILKDKIPFNKEIPGKMEKYNDYILTSIRTMWGTDLELIGNFYGEDYKNYCASNAEQFIQKGYLTNKENKLILTGEGQLIADYITSSLFMT